MAHPLDPHALAGVLDVCEPRISPSGRQVGWIESVDGDARLVVAPADGSGPPTALYCSAPLAPTGSYGGGVWCWDGDARGVVCSADGRLLAVAIDGSGTLVLTSHGRAASPHAAEGWVVCTIDEGDESAVAIVPSDATAWARRISGPADFTRDPVLSRDGRVAWCEWDLPNMPWDASRVMIADPYGRAGPSIAAGGDEVSVQQPRFSPDGTRLAYVADVSGVAVVWTSNPDGSDARPLEPEAARERAFEPAFGHEHDRTDHHDARDDDARSPRFEHAEPSWGPGQRSFAWSPDGTEIALCRNEDGFGRLVVVRVADGGVRELSRGWHHGLDWGDAGIVAVRSGAVTPPQVVLTDPARGSRRVLARGAPAGIESGAVEPEAVRWRGADGADVHGLLYRPTHSALAPEPPPMLVDVHGGPTSAAVVAWRGETAFWTSRGWAVLRPNHRGSSGYGREYAQALAGRWGELDVADTAAGIEHANRAGWCAPGRVAVTGGSAGGFTALLVALRRPDLVRAAAVSYAVTDLFALAESTHRFESRYLDRIVGMLPEHADRYRDRSPVTLADRARVPLLVLQGDADRVVPVEQAVAFVDAARGQAGPDVTIEVQVYEGEGHGWARTDTIVDALERTETFLARWVLRR